MIEAAVKAASGAKESRPRWRTEKKWERVFKGKIQFHESEGKFTDYLDISRIDRRKVVKIVPWRILEFSKMWFTFAIQLADIGNRIIWNRNYPISRPIPAQSEVSNLFTPQCERNRDRQVPGRGGRQICPFVHLKCPFVRFGGYRSDSFGIRCGNVVDRNVACNSYCSSNKSRLS